MRYDVLRDYCLQGETPIRLNTYLAFDDERARADREYAEKQYGYFSILRNFGFKVVTKSIRKYMDEEGNWISKANVDLDMAVDMLMQAEKLDKIYLLTGSGDFKRVVQAVQSKGVRVELIAFKNCSQELRYEVDEFTSGYMIPNLLPVEGQDLESWGELDHRVRGQCYATSEGYGFMKYMDQEFGYHEVFVPFALLPRGFYLRLDNVYEFELQEGQKGLLAAGVTTV